MCFHLAKRAISSHFHFQLFPSSPFQHHLSLLLNPLLCFSLSTQTQVQTASLQPHKDLPFIADYLVSSLGFSPDRALKVSKYSNLAAIKSPDRPEAVIKFLKDTGLSDSQIKSTVLFYPILLGSNVEKTLQPKVRELLENGFSGELLAQLIQYNPNTLHLKDTLLRLLFWKDFVGNSDEALLKMIPKNPLLFTFDIDKQIVPVINLLKEYELSNLDIVSLLGARNYRLRQNPDALKQKLELIEEMGFLRGSRMFLRAIKVVGGVSCDMIGRKFEFFKTMYGWSQEEVYSAFRKLPTLLTFSKDKVKSNMDFLIRIAGFESRSIALQPRLLSCSVERVLIPRYTVLSALEAKGLKKHCSLFTACIMSESNFLKRYVVPYEKDVPGLGGAYAAAYDGRKVLADTRLC